MELAGTSWTVQRVSGADVPWRVGMTVELAADGTVRGSTGVSSYRSWWTLADDVLTVGPLVMTTRGAVPQRAALDQAWVALLSQPCRVRGDAHALLLGEDTRLVRAPPRAAGAPGGGGLEG